MIIDEIKNYKDCTDSFIIFDEYQDILFVGTYERLLTVLRKDAYMRRILSGNGKVQAHTTVIQLYES